MRPMTFFKELSDHSFADNMTLFHFRGRDLEKNKNNDGEADEMSPDVKGLIVHFE